MHRSFVLITRNYISCFFSGINALKFESKETRSTRLCRKIGDIFEPPEDGWGDRLYFAHSPLSQTTSLSSQGMSTSNGELFFIEDISHSALRGDSTKHQLLDASTVGGFFESLKTCQTLNSKIDFKALKRAIFCYFMTK